MTHTDLVNVIVAIHGALLGGAFLAYLKYGDRTEVFKRSLEGTDELLRRMRQQIVADLGERLGEVFRGNEAAPSVIIRPDGGAYTEQCTNPVGGERYKECVRDFIEGSDEALVDYRLAFTARQSWCFWAKGLSWCILALIVWEAIVAGSSGLLDRICSIPISDWVLEWAGAPTAMMVAACLVVAAFCLRRHDTLQKVRLRYDGP
jgi:hypothetical protein